MLKEEVELLKKNMDNVIAAESFAERHMTSRAVSEQGASLMASIASARVSLHDGTKLAINHCAFG